MICASASFAHSSSSWSVSLCMRMHAASHQCRVYVIERHTLTLLLSGSFCSGASRPVQENVNGIVSATSNQQIVTTHGHDDPSQSTHTHTV